MTLETKTHLDPSTINQLQELIQINVDSRDGFQLSAEVIDDMALSTLFRSLAHQREEQANELARFVEWNQQTPRHEGTYAAALHRTWLGIREKLSSNNLYAVLAEAERGEDQIKNAYEAALRAHPGSAMNDVLNQQYAQVKASHDRIRDLRDEHQHD
jgi:uncharacterized protein (TIGR02284 family)